MISKRRATRCGRKVPVGRATDPTSLRIRLTARPTGKGNCWTAWGGSIKRRPVRAAGRLEPAHYGEGPSYRCRKIADVGRGPARVQWMTWRAAGRRRGPGRCRPVEQHRRIEVCRAARRLICLVSSCREMVDHQLARSPALIRFHPIRRRRAQRDDIRCSRPQAGEFRDKTALVAL